MFNFLKNLLFETGGYEGHPEAVIIACYYNPEKSPYRLKAFNMWYDSIKHLNHRVIECVIGNGSPELPTNNPNISQVKTDALLWHKEALLNSLIAGLPTKFRYIFWSDTDILLTNPKWMVEGVKQLEQFKVIQPFEHCVHLDRDEVKPSFNLLDVIDYCDNPRVRHPKVWRSFCSNVSRGKAADINYDVHGHVGFIWGARRSVLERIGLYDKALIGGADHIIAHAAAGHIPHACITNSFKDNIAEVTDWSERFYIVVGGSIGFVHGELYHLWHGDIENREYLRRVQEFTPHTKEITEKDSNGLYKNNNPATKEYMESYYKRRESLEPAKKAVKKSTPPAPKPKKVLPAHPPRRPGKVYNYARGRTYSYNNQNYWYNNSGYLFDNLGNLIQDYLILEMILDNNDVVYDNGSLVTQPDDFGGFGGGTTDGGGAGGSWQDDNQYQSSGNDQQDNSVDTSGDWQNNNNNQLTDSTSYQGSTFS